MCANGFFDRLVTSDCLVKSYIFTKMSNKRCAEQETNDQNNKKMCKSISSSSSPLSIVGGVPKTLSETYSALLTIRNLFPVKRFYDKLPPIVMQHQIYDLISSRTTVDRDLKNLQRDGHVCVFKMGAEILARAVILTEDLLDSARKLYPDNALITKFLGIIVPLGTVEVEKSFLENSFSQREISELMHLGYLVFSSDTNYSYFLSFPNAGHFMKAYIKGRKVILQAIKKSKYDEMLQPELESRNLEKTVVLGTRYHIHDVVGADLVQSIETTSGRMLRLRTTR